MANIDIINTNSDRVCAMRLTINYVDIILINVYMPCEGSETSTDEFTTQLSVIDDIIEQHQNCQITLGGDFNVDFSRSWSHSSLLFEFCEQSLIFFAIKHICNAVDYTYHFAMKRFQILDYFILSGEFFDTVLQNSFQCMKLITPPITPQLITPHRYSWVLLSRINGWHLRLGDIAHGLPG